MSRRIWLVAVGILAASIGRAAPDTKSIELKSAPKAIQKAVQLWLAGGLLNDLEQVNENGHFIYEVEYTNKEGKDRDFTLAANGTLQSLEIALAEAPGPVQKYLINSIGTGKLDSIEKNLDGEDPSFDITMVTPDGKNHDFTLDSEGKMVSQRVELADIPATIEILIKSLADNNPIDDVEKLWDSDSTFSYQVAFTTKEGLLRSFTINAADGKLESREIGLGDAPPAVQKTVTTEIGNGQLESLDKILDPDATFYEAAYYTKTGRERRFAVGADGKINSREMTLPETPAAVQATIKQQVGSGKILRIDHSFLEKDSGVFPFEVQAEKDGKPFDFSVGPRGRFLGMDD